MDWNDPVLPIAESQSDWMKNVWNDWNYWNHWNRLRLETFEPNLERAPID
jgi:hypothetical protein